MSMFINLCQTPPHFQFTKKLNNWNLENAYLVACSSLLVVCGRLLVICDRLLVICDR